MTFERSKEIIRESKGCMWNPDWNNPQKKVRFAHVGDMDFLPAIKFGKIEDQLVVDCPKKMDCSVSFFIPTREEINSDNWEAGNC
jgi:hypothetical protein